MRFLDFHCHVYPRAIAEKASHAVAKFYEGQWGDHSVTQPCTLQDVLHFQEEAGIEKSLLCSAATVPHQVRHINEFLARKAEESEGRCVAFGTLHPDSPDVAGDIEHLISLGLKGVKLHPDMQQFALDSEGAMWLYELADNQLPFLLHTGDRRFPYSNPEQLIPVLEAFPKTTFIGAHMGGFSLWEEATKALAGKYENLYVDVSSSMFAFTPEKMAELIRAYGADRVLFGTDFPMLHPKTEVEQFLALPLTDEEKRLIAWENGAKILGLA